MIKSNAMCPQRLIIYWELSAPAHHSSQRINLGSRKWDGRYTQNFSFIKLSIIYLHTIDIKEREKMSKTVYILMLWNNPKSWKQYILYLLKISEYLRKRIKLIEFNGTFRQRIHINMKIIAGDLFLFLLHPVEPK